MTGIALLGSGPLDAAACGNKALGLWKLMNAGAKVPPTVIVTADHQVDGPALTAVVAGQVGTHPAYVVRSSSTVEDGVTQSMAGMFLSVSTDLGGVPDAVEQVRRHARAAVTGGVDPLIPVLIQPRLDGSGGVYLSDYRAGRDSLVLSTLGPSAVTSGATTATDQLPTDSPSCQAALSACRDIARRLGGSVDLELVLGQGGCVFLQYRPLTRPLPAAKPEGVSSYFPGWLPPLVGTLWGESLSAALGTASVRYEDGYILGLDSSPEGGGDLELTPDVLHKAEEYYRHTLIPEWDDRAERLGRDIEALPPDRAWERCVAEWEVFLDQYFNNPFEGVVTAARMAAPPGMAFSPRNVERLGLFGRASEAVQAQVTLPPAERHALAEVRAYLDAFGFYLLEEHDFSQPTLAEQPDVLLAQLSQAGQIVIPAAKADDPLLRVAWLAEDDNECKHRYLSLLRRCVLRLGRHLAENGSLAATDDIWSVTKADIGPLLRGDAVRGTRAWSLTTSSLPRPPAGPRTLSAEVLAPGRATGAASLAGQVGAGRILVRTVIETADYPLLMSSAGAVVALGTPLSHGAIFARDVGKPLYRCPAVLNAVDDGTLLTLLDSPPRVHVGEGRPTKENAVKIDPRSATPCRTVAFTPDGKHLAEANYLGFVTIRRAEDGHLAARYMAQTALVETIRFDQATGDILMVGAGFEGRRDNGVVKVLSLMDGRRLGELKGHKDDATDVMPLPGPGRRVVSVGLDRRVIVHDLDDPARTWVWDGYEDYLNTCSPRPGHDGQFAVAGDSPYTYILDARERRVVAQVETPGDCNGLIWSADGRYLLVGDDHAEVKYIDSERGWKQTGTSKVGGAAKRMVADPGFPDRVLVACYDGRVWSVPAALGAGEPRVAVDRRPGLWGINVSATATRIAVPTFSDRAYLLRRDAQGNGAEAVGPEPQPTFGCNWIAVNGPAGLLAVTHDDC
ncbi:MAG: PEP-utilizing enzyme [Gemmata sp.]